MQIVSFLKGKIRNKEVFKKVTNKSRKLVRKIHRNTSRTAKSHKNVYDKSLEGENSLKNADSSLFILFVVAIYELVNNDISH